MVWYGEKILDPVSIIDGSTSTFQLQAFYLCSCFLVLGSCISRFFTFAYLRYTNKQVGAKEEGSSLDNKMYIRVRQ